MGHTMVMGRKTWDSIGRAAARSAHHRRQPRSRCGRRAAPTSPARSPTALVLAGDAESFVVGGGEIYAPDDRPGRRPRAHRGRRRTATATRSSPRSTVRRGPRSPASRTRASRSSGTNAPRGCRSGVVVELDLGRSPGATGRPALARGPAPPAQGVVAVHPHLALDQPGPAGAADPAGAGERRVRAGPQRGGQDRLGPVGMSTVVVRPSRLTVTVPPRRPRRPPSSERGGGGSSSTWNSSRWTCPGSAPAARRSSSARAGHHPERPAEVPLVDRVHRQHGVEDPAQALGVEPAGEQLGVLGLPGEHVDQLEPRRVPVLEVLQLLEEHDRRRTTVAIEQRCPAVRLRSSALASRDRTGVMPLPAATATWCRPGGRPTASNRR